ncbi:LysR substrate-binding domain-containing protein [Neisseria sp. P0001.S005]|uniref:LysR substrate-binding domain-containing protein n=1 Tax=Neisseria TaxID=482 RepID=UPI000A70A1A3|nr:LysR substrate-binding domain-containing protein [Neisseria flavescens]
MLESRFKNIGIKIFPKLFSDDLGITWLPHIIATDALHSGQPVELLPEYAMTYEPLYLYYPSRRGHSNVFKLIVDALRVEVV